MAQTTKKTFFNPNFDLSVTTAGSSSLESVKKAPLISWLPCSYNILFAYLSLFSKLRFISSVSFHMHPQITRQNQCKVALFAKVRFISSVSVNVYPQTTRKFKCKVTFLQKHNLSPPCYCCRIDHCQKRRWQAHRGSSYLNIPRSAWAGTAGCPS